MTTGSKATTVVAATTGLGCLAAPFGVAFMAGSIFLIGGFGILLLPIVIIYMIFNGLSLSGLGDLGNPNDGLTGIEQRCEDEESLQLHKDPDAVSRRAAAIITGDGHGELERSTPDSNGKLGNEPCTVPKDLYDTIQDAGGVCDAIGPVVIASQIQYESGFDAKFVGPNGAQGISQINTEEFKRLEGDDADPFDAKKSIDAQGKYLCELSKQVQDLLNQKEITGNMLDLTLSAYDVGIGSVQASKGVPPTNGSQRYIVGVRTWFASMEGIGPIPRKLAGVKQLRDDDGAVFDPNSTPKIVRR
ncbi:lytic transglycosylase domain-containing protein [Streptomyces sp. NPDC048489]|uniref:lytic transglycosylase domain-containing protein n=1 Tax=Streptomyces sp. NPDC048489 TaxID=3154504 RepID=UPI00341AA530